MMQTKTIVAVISLVTMVGAAYAAGTSVAENLLRAQNRDLEQTQQTPVDWALSTETFGQSAEAEVTTPKQAAAQDPAPPAEDQVSFTPEVQVVTERAADQVAESPELRSLMSGGRGEEGYFFRSRGEDYGYEEGYEEEDEHEDGHEDHERYEKQKKKYEKQKKKEKKLREARFGLFEGPGAFEEDD